MHRHTRKTAAEAPGHDSFLDIVANMVGILIILVTVVGLRVKNAPPAASISSPEADSDRDLQEDLSIEQSLRKDVLEAAEETRNLQQQMAAWSRQRDALATTVAAAENRIRSRRRQMDARSRSDFDLDRNLSDTRLRLEQIERQRVRTENEPTSPIIVESHPTPLSQRVDGHEAHFQLRGGRVTPLPFQELMERVVADARLRSTKLFNPQELTGTVGPEGGFRASYRYTPAGRFVQLIPVSRHLGESLDEALAEGSRFRRRISKLSPHRSTVTIWTYPDSFGELRRLKTKLFRLGFATAARPLPQDVHIGSASHGGTKSAAQ